MELVGVMSQPEVRDSSGGPELGLVQMLKPREVLAEEEMPESHDSAMLLELKQPAPRSSYLTWEISSDGQPNRLLHELAEECTKSFLKKVDKKPAFLVRCIKQRRERDLSETQRRSYLVRALSTIFGR